MKKMTKNPFKFGDPVRGDYYFPRKNLSKAVAQFLENRINVVLIGPRRFGKNSFVLNLLEHFEKNSIPTLFVDIFNITSHRDFLDQFLRALHSKKTWMDHLKKIGKSLVNMQPTVSANFDETNGQPSLGLSFHLKEEKNVKKAIQDVLTDLDSLGKNVVIVIDEFQKVSEIDDQGWLEATLRTHMQQLRHTSFLFTGSRRSIIYDMLNNASRPFYRSCQPIEFPAFGPEFTEWIVQKFSEIDFHCTNQAIDHLRNLVQDIPNYVQMICFHLVTEGKTHIDIEAVDSTLIKVVKQNSYTYQILLNSLSVTQQRALRLAAIEKKQIYAKDFLKKYEISSTPALASAIKSLKIKGILEEGFSKGNVFFDDPLFAIWLKFVFSNGISKQV